MKNNILNHILNKFGTTLQPIKNNQTVSYFKNMELTEKKPAVEYNKEAEASKKNSTIEFNEIAETSENNSELIPALLKRQQNFNKVLELLNQYQNETYDNFFNLDNITSDAKQKFLQELLESFNNGNTSKISNKINTFINKTKKDIIGEISILIHNNPTILNMGDPDNKNKTIGMLASDMKIDKIVELAITNSDNLNQKDDDGKSFTSYCIENGYIELINSHKVEHSNKSNIVTENPENEVSKNDDYNKNSTPYAVTIEYDNDL